MNKRPKISVPVFTVERKGCWVAYCPVLKIYGYSQKDEKTALQDFDNAIDTFFHVQGTLGTLNNTLLKLGWTRHDHKVAAPTNQYNSAFSPYREKSTYKAREISLPSAYA